MSAVVKCEQCGHPFNPEKDNNRCPYCGTELNTQKTAIDHEEFMAIHKEKVRQTMVKESRGEEIRSVLFPVILILILFSLFLIPVFVKSTNLKNEEKKLENLSNQIQQHILEGRLDEAQMEASNLRLVSNWSSNAKEKWDRVREDYQKLIKEKQKTAQKTCIHNWVQTGNERDSGFLFWWTHQDEYKCSKCGNIEWRNSE